VGIAVAGFVGIFLLIVPNLLITKIIIAPLFALLAFLIYKYLTGFELTVKVKLPRISTQWIVVTVYLFTVAIVVLVPSVSFTQLQLSWSDLPWSNILRGVSAIVLSTFLRGYVFVQLIGKWRSSKIEVLVFSFLLSVFVTSVVAFVDLLAFGRVEGNSILFYVVDLGLILSYLIMWRKRGGTVIQSLTFDLPQAAILLTVMALVYANILVGLLNSSPLQWMDSWNYYGMGYRMYVGDWLTGLQFPSFFFFYLAAFYESSGLPSINAYQALHIINIFSVVSFFLMVRGFFKGSRAKVPIMATIVFFLGGGLGWIYGLWIRPSLSGLPDYSRVGYVLDAIIRKTMDQGTFMPRYLTASESLSFVCLFALIYVLSVKTKDGSNKFLLGVLCTVSLTAGYLSHFPEMLFFLLLLTVLLLIIPSSKFKSIAIYVHIPYILAASLLLIVLYDVLAPSRYYSNNLILLVGPFLFPIVLSFLKQRQFFGNRVVNFCSQWLRRTFNSRRFWIFVTGTLIAVTFLYVYSFVIWVGILPQFQIKYVQLQSYGYSASIANRVPWYLYPMLLGVPGLFAIFGLYYLYHKKKRISNFAIFLAIGLTSLVLAGVMRVWPIFEETRIVTRYLWIAVSVVAGLALLKAITKIGSHFSNRIIRKQIISCGLVFLFICASIPSNIYYTELVASFNPILGAQLSSNELNGLNWLRINQEPNSRVLTVTLVSTSAVSYFASSPRWIGDFGKGLPPSNLFLNTADPAMLFDLLHQSNVGYIYIAERDKPFIPTDSLVQILLKYLPVVFENEAVKIYQVPPVSAYTKGADILLVNQQYSNSKSIDVEDFYSTSMFSLSGIPYDLATPYDNLQLVDRRNVVLTGDIDENVFVLNHSNTKWYATGSTFETNGEGVKIMGAEESQGIHDYWIDLNLDSNLYRYISIPWRTDNVTNVYVILHGNNTGYKFVGLGTSPSWTTTIINVADMFPSDSLDQLLFRTYDTNTSYELRSIEFGGSPLFGYNVTSYLDWVLSGGNLFVLGGRLFNGTFAKLLSLSPSGATSMVNGVSDWLGDPMSAAFPSITIPFVETADNQTRIVAYYTNEGANESPFAFRRDFGKGTITYIMSSPYFDAIQASNVTNASALFMQLGQLPCAVMMNISKNFSSSKTDIWDVSSYAVGEVKMSGNVVFSGSYVEPQESQPFNTTSIVLSRNDESAQIQGGRALNLEMVGDSSSLIAASFISMSPPYQGLYVNFYVGGNFNWTIGLAPNATINFDLYENGLLQRVAIDGPCNVTFQNVSTSESFRIISREPTFTLAGQLFSSNLKYAPASIFFIPTVLNGNVTLTTSLGSQDMITFSKIEFAGKWVPVAPEAQIQWNEWQIPWLNILTSPYSLIFIIASTIIIAYIQIHRLRHSSMKQLRSDHSYQGEERK